MQTMALFVELLSQDELDVDEELEADSQIIDSSQSLPPIPTPRSTWPLDGDSENMASMGLFSLSHMHRHEMVSTTCNYFDTNSHSRNIRRPYRTPSLTATVIRILKISRPMALFSPAHHHKRHIKIIAIKKISHSLCTTLCRPKAL